MRRMVGAVAVVALGGSWARPPSADSAGGEPFAVRVLVTVQVPADAGPDFVERLSRVGTSW